jgi:voltage-gated potassium channel
VPTFHVEKLVVPRKRRWCADSRLWREWCFVVVLFKSFRTRLLFIAIIVLLGTLAFRLLEPERQRGVPEALHCVWSLIMGNPPEDFPRQSVTLQILFFVLPLLGLTVILESIVNFALILRDRRRAELHWCQTMAASYSDHVILVGLGKLGYRTFLLLRKLGEAVVVIERNPENQFLDEIRRDGAPLFIRDARREAVLQEANVERARSIVCAMDDDMANLEVALDARRFAPHIRVVLRMFDQNIADKLKEGLSIHTAVSQSAISAPVFAMAAVDPTIVNTQVVNDRLIIMQRWYVRAKGPLCDLMVADVLERFGFGIVEHQPKDGPPRLYPPPGTKLQADDRLIVQGPYEALTRLHRESIQTT